MNIVDKPKAVILLSGGLDSATVLAIAQQEFSCHAISFDYQQRHNSELHAARKITHLTNITHQIIQINQGVLVGSALTDENIDIPETLTTGIPVTYVPARNTVFLSHALAVAEVIGSSDIFIGVNAVDYSGYPDCRPEYIEAFATMANLATRSAVEGERVHIHTPLINMSKAEIILAGTKLGVDYASTVSCYQADTDGRACGVCDSCQYRIKGFDGAGIADPTRYK